jgi:SecD/SecF fusion protein
LIVVLILYTIGGEGIHGFAYCLVLGVIVGTYSSIFIASPTLLWLMNRPGSATARATHQSEKQASVSSR